MKARAVVLLLLLNVALSLTLAWLWFTPAGTVRGADWKRPQAQTNDYRSMVPLIGEVVPADSAKFVAMLERPLFSSTRRPPPPPPPVEPVVAPLVDSLSTARISGMFQGDGVAGVIISVGGKDRRIRLQESVDGWVLQSVSGTTATFVGQGQTRTLTLPRAALTGYAGLPLTAVPVNSPPQAQVPPSPAQVPAAATPAAPSPPAKPPVATFGGR